MVFPPGAAVALPRGARFAHEGPVAADAGPDPPLVGSHVLSDEAVGIPGADTAQLHERSEARGAARAGIGAGLAGGRPSQDRILQVAGWDATDRRCSGGLQHIFWLGLRGVLLR